MKQNKVYIYIYLLLSLFIFSDIAVFCQLPDNNIIQKALKDELTRSITHLEMENLQSPFFISYNIFDAKTLAVNSSLGAIIGSEAIPIRTFSVKVLVGDYKLNNENFQSGFGVYSGGRSMIIEDDYNGIRIALWKETDRQYKSAAESYENKLSAMKQQNLTEEMNISDLIKVPVVKVDIPGSSYQFDKQKWENVAKELSSVFLEYNDIFSSKVKILLYHAYAYYINTEGTEVKSPINIAAVKVFAQTMADDGEPLSDHLLYYAIDQDNLPNVKQMKEGTITMADMLVALKNAPVLDEDYAGPILFEDQAVAEVFSQSLFAGNLSMYTKRKPIFGNAQMAMYSGQVYEKNLESTIDRKVISRDITIKALSTKTESMGNKLIGSYKVDLEGVVPDDELILVDNGVLKTLLSNRIPTEKVKFSNGHFGHTFQSGRIFPEITPGVISVSTISGSTKSDLRKKLFEIAREEDLDYAYKIRKLESNNAGIEKDIDMAMMSMGGASETLSKPLYIYKVSLENGTEELVRTAKLGEMTIRILKKMTGASNKQFVYNSLVSKSTQPGLMLSNPTSPEIYSLTGIPASFIVPDAILFDDLDVFKDSRTISKKLPAVSNPVGEKLY